MKIIETEKLIEVLKRSEKVNFSLEELKEILEKYGHDFFFDKP